MSIELASLFLTGISALSSVIQALKGARRKGTRLPAKKVDQVLEKPKKRKKGAVTLTLVIDEDRLRVILENIEEIQVRMKNTLDNPSSTDQEIDREVEIARNTICKALNTIRHLNQGVLPSKHLLKLWVSHQCTET